MIAYSLPDPSDFEYQIDGKNTHLFILRNACGMYVALTDYGARIVSILVPDKHGNLTDVALGFDSIKGYLDAYEVYHGATIGRYANRIAKGIFNLNGKPYSLELNNGTNSLHGGPGGFHSKVWDRRINIEKAIDFVLLSPDGDEGFPGNVKVNVNYELTNDNEIIITYRASTDQDTHLNLTNHTFFNLNGEGNGDILSHELQIYSDKYIPIDSVQIPLGHEESVAGTAFDFRNSKPIIDNIGNDDVQITHGNGYDHTFVTRDSNTSPIATAFSSQSGICMDVYTSEPGVQLYTGNFLDGQDIGKSGHEYKQHSAFCLETQHYPDTPNQLHFPSTLLCQGKEYHSKTIYKFSLKH